MRKGFPLKPEDSPPADAAGELASYFETPAYQHEVERQRGSHATLQAIKARQREVARELAAYWTDAAYAHAANVAAAIERRAS